jgi:pimeloyl-ACP methyl ester carboxylesterase
MATKSIYKSEAGRQQIMALYDAALANWLVPYQTCSIPTRHGETFAIASGDPAAPPLLLVHGSSSNAVSWIGEAAVFGRSFRVYAVDLPGEPGCSAQDRPSWQNLDFAEWMSDVLDGLRIEKTALLGISQGGWTALRFATCAPGRVERLVLLAPGGVAATRSSFIVKAVWWGMFGRRGAERINRYVFGDQPIHETALEFMNAILTHFKARIEKEYLFSDEELKRLDMPTLLVVGGKDVIVDSRKVIGRLERLLPRLTVKVLPEAGHALIGLGDQVLPFLVEKSR